MILLDDVYSGKIGFVSYLLVNISDSEVELSSGPNKTSCYDKFLITYWTIKAHKILKIICAYMS